MLLKRILSAIVGIPAILLLVWYGQITISLLVLLIVILGLIEMNRLWHRMGVNAWLPAAILGGCLYIATANTAASYGFPAALFVTVACAAIYLVKVYPSFSFTDLAATVFSSLYVGWLLTHLIGIRELAGGFHFVLLVLATTWSTDTFAYFVGINFGRRKLAPALSPGKTVEGSVGGVIGSIAVGVIVGLVGQEMPILHYAIVGLLVGVMGQVGDLLESALKRLAQVKDSGGVIPGHGGILDRFDSLLLTAPVVYYYLKVFIMK